MKKLSILSASVFLIGIAALLSFGGGDSPEIGAKPVEHYYDVFVNVSDGTILEIEATKTDYTQLGTKEHVDPVAPAGYKWVQSYSKFPETPTPLVSKIASNSHETIP